MNIIDRAASNLKGHWYQGGMYDGEGNACAVGHLVSVGFSHDSYRDAVRISHRVAAEQFPDRLNHGNPLIAKSGALIVVNDHPDTTEEDVLKIFEKASIEFDSRVDTDD